MISKILSPSVKGFLINSGIVTGLSLTSLAGVAMMHIETDRASRQQAFEVQQGCAAQDSRLLSNCDSSTEEISDEESQMTLAGIGGARNGSPDRHSFEDQGELNAIDRQK